MRNLKRFFRWSSHKFSVAILANAVAIGIPLLAFGIHITNPQIIKDWLSRTDTYETLVTESLNLIELDAENAKSVGTLGDTLDENPFVDKETVVEAMRSTLTPEFIEEQATSFIDGVYAWLDSDQEIPNFEFSLAEKNIELAEKLGDALSEQFNQMPDCLPEDYQATFNLLDTLCKPPGVDITYEVDRLVAELAGSEGLLANTTWTGEDLVQQEGEEGGLNPSQVNIAKGAYSGLKNGPTFMIIAGALMVPVVFLSSRSQYKGYNEIANTLFTGALFTFIPAIIIAQWENIITNLIGDSGGNDSTVVAARAVFEPFLQAAVNDIASLAAWMSGIMLVFSSALVAYGFYLKHLYEEDEEEKMAHEILERKEERRIAEVKMHAKKRAKYDHHTVDPVTHEPLQHRTSSISPEEAQQIANDPANQTKKISEL